MSASRKQKVRAQDLEERAHSLPLDAWKGCADSGASTDARWSLAAHGHPRPRRPSAANRRTQPQVVGDQTTVRRAVAVEPGDQLHDRRLRLRVDAGGRLVEQENGGSTASARAISTRCFCPPESSQKGRLAQIGEPHLLEALGGAAGAAAGPPDAAAPARIGAHQHDLERGQREDRVERVALRDVPRRAGRAVEAVVDPPRQHRHEPEHAAQAASSCRRRSDRASAMNSPRSMANDTCSSTARPRSRG